MSDFKLWKICWIQWKLSEKLSPLKGSVSMLRKYKDHHIQVSIRYVLQINYCFVLMIVNTRVTPLWWHCCPIFIKNITCLAFGGASYISYFAWVVLRYWSTYNKFTISVGFGHAISSFFSNKKITKNKKIIANNFDDIMKCPVFDCSYSFVEIIHQNPSVKFNYRQVNNTWCIQC